MSSSVDCKASQVLLRSLTELQQRRLIRKDLTLWVEPMGLRTSVPPPPPHPPPPSGSAGKLDRMAIFMPPGSAKSTSASILFSPRYLSHALLLGGYLKPRQLRFTRRRRLRRKGG